MTPEMISQIKRKLNITWDDADTNARVTEIAENAIEILMYKCGIHEADRDCFTTAGQENQILLAYCLYSWNHVEDTFDSAYFNDLEQLRAKYEVKYNEDSGEDGDV